MRLPSPLIEGRLVRRYKRFLADVELKSGEVVTVHCANPGAMTGLAEPGMRVLISRSTNPKRKLPLSWELVKAKGGLVGINTSHPNRIVEEAVRADAIPELTGYESLAREVRYAGNSRVDFVLSDPAKPDAYLEVKNVHLLRQEGLAEFPDSVTARGTKHLDALAGMVAAGHRAVMLYLIQRTDADRFSLARDIDPTYAAAFDRARDSGVEVLAYRCAISREEIVVAAAIPLVD